MNEEPKEMAMLPDSNCINIATISAGFEKGDFLVREEQGNRVYFDFFEEVSPILMSNAFFVVPVSNTLFVIIQAFNYISNKGYSRMAREDEKHWVDLMNVIHDSVKGGMKYNTGTLLMVLSRPVSLDKIPPVEKIEKPVTKAKTPSKETLPKNLNP
jgi:hypothetical protein